MKPDLWMIFAYFRNALKIIDRTSRRGPDRRSQKERPKPFLLSFLNCLPDYLPTQAPSPRFGGYSAKLDTRDHRCFLGTRMCLIRAKHEELPAGGIHFRSGEG